MLQPRRGQDGDAYTLAGQPMFVSGLIILHVIYNGLLFSFFRFSTSAGVPTWVTLVALLSAVCVVANIKALRALLGTTEDDDAAWFRRAFRNGTLRALATTYLGTHLAISGVMALVFGLSVLVGGLFLI